MTNLGLLGSFGVLRTLRKIFDSISPASEGVLIRDESLVRGGADVTVQISSMICLFSFTDFRRICMMPEAENECGGKTITWVPGGGY